MPLPDRRAAPGVAWGGLALLAALCTAGAGRAQVAASATVVSNDLYRGLSLSAGQPAADLTVTYDDARGAYLGASAIGGIVRQAGPVFLGEIAYLGYAARLRRGPTLDVGVQVLDYRTHGEYARDYDAAEIYTGWVAGRLNAYLHYCPDYLRSGERTLYGEINGVAPLAPRWRLFGHLGALTRLAGGSEAGTRYDLRAGIAASFKGGEAQLSWTTTLPDNDRSGPYVRGAGVISVGLTLLL